MEKVSGSVQDVFSVCVDQFPEVEVDMFNIYLRGYSSHDVCMLVYQDLFPEQSGGASVLKRQKSVKSIKNHEADAQLRRMWAKCSIRVDSIAARCVCVCVSVCLAYLVFVCVKESRCYIYALSHIYTIQITLHYTTLHYTALHRDGQISGAFVRQRRRLLAVLYNEVNEQFRLYETLQHYLNNPRLFPDAPISISLTQVHIRMCVCVCLCVCSCLCSHTIYKIPHTHILAHMYTHTHSFMHKLNLHTLSYTPTHSIVHT
jgi:hypothetical protein